LVVRVERACHRRCVHTPTRICDGEQNVFTGRHLWGICGIHVVEGRIGDLDGQLPAVRHGVTAVDDQIEDGRLKLRGVDPRIPQIACSNTFDGHGFSYGPTDARQNLVHYVIKIDDSRLQGLATRKGQQLLSQPAAAFDRDLDHADAFQRLLVATREPPQKIQTADNDSEKVIEVVRHPPRYPAKRFHILRLPQSLLGAPLLANVENSHHVAINDTVVK
jgi:hypothetical protein